MKPELTAQRLRELLSYDPDIGQFTRRITVASRARAGDIAGCPNTNGYIVIRLDYRLYYAHRLAFLHETGEWPKLEVDHVDLDPSNNAWSNLRDVPHEVNMQNLREVRSHKASGLPLGVHRDRNGRIFAAISVDGQYRYLGGFDDAVTAYAAYLAAKRDVHAGCML